MIVFENWQLQAPYGGVIARQYDNLSRSLLVEGELPADYSWAMLVRAGEAMDVIPLSPMEGGVGVVLTANQLALSGHYMMQLRGTRGEEVRHTNVIGVVVPPSLSGDGKWPEFPSEFIQLEQRLQKLAAHPPRPGENGYWMVWDADRDEYAESAFPVGLTGPAGRDGDAGVPGVDGISPTLAVTDTADGHRITITDAQGVNVFDVTDGAATDEQVNAWLTAHPEATTTVQDGAVTPKKTSGLFEWDSYDDGKREIIHTVPNFTNLFPGCGYVSNSYVDASKPADTYSAKNGFMVAKRMASAKTDVFRVKGAVFDDAGCCKIGAYTSDLATRNQIPWSSISWNNFVTIEDGVYVFDLSKAWFSDAQVKFVEFSFRTPADLNGVIITRNQPITYRDEVEIVQGEESYIGLRLSPDVSVPGNNGVEINKNIIYDSEQFRNALLRQENKNIFKYKAFDKPYILLVCDDGRHDLDLVASVCEEFGVPLNMAVPPENLSNTCDGLKAPRGSYTVGMTVKNVCKKAVALGGEVLTHNIDVITASNQNDYTFMYHYFVEQKRLLEENGFAVRGIIRAGGTGALAGNVTSLKWCLQYYDYSDNLAPEGYIQYKRDRRGMSSSVDGLKQYCNSLNKTTQFGALMMHTLDGTENGLCEATLREFIPWAKAQGWTFTTYAYLFDHYASSANA